MVFISKPRTPIQQQKLEKEIGIQRGEKKRINIQIKRGNQKYAMVTYEALEKKLKETNRNWKWEYEGYVNEMQKSKKKQMSTP